MKPIARVAFWVAMIGPIQSVLGWTIAGSLWPGYDPIRQTISDLAANDSPVNLIMSSFFVFGGIITLVAAVYARTLAIPGRVALFISALCTFGLTIFPTPLVGYSLMHRIFAISSFVLSAGWPILAMRFRKDAPWIIKPLASTISTSVQTALALWFLSTWTDPQAADVGVWERVVAVSQSLYVSVVIITIYLSQKSVIPDKVRLGRNPPERRKSWLKRNKRLKKIPRKSRLKL